jgi:hypothetical protein
MDKGAFIMHRIHGSTVDIDEGGKRAVVKMKATITQRFELPPKAVLVDAESDCRYVAFCKTAVPNQYLVPKILYVF